MQLLMRNRTNQRFIQLAIPLHLQLAITRLANPSARSASQADKCFMPKRTLRRNAFSKSADSSLSESLSEDRAIYRLSTNDDAQPTLQALT